MEGKLYSMKETCLKTGMNYEALKFYCKEGLVPNVNRQDMLDGKRKYKSNLLPEDSPLCARSTVLTEKETSNAG